MSTDNKNKLIVAVSLVASFISGCILGKYIRGQFTLLRLVLGSILLAIAIGPDSFGWYGIIYCVRCLFGILGATIIGKMTDYNLHSLGMLILGILIYFVSMAPNSFDMVSYYTTIDQNILQISFRLIGAFILFVGFYNPDK
jgi:hypothetical protein